MRSTMTERDFVTVSQRETVHATAPRHREHSAAAMSVAFIDIAALARLLAAVLAASAARTRALRSARTALALTAAARGVFVLLVVVLRLHGSVCPFANKTRDPSRALQRGVFVQCSMVDSAINISGIRRRVSFVYRFNHFFSVTEKRFCFILISEKPTCTVNDAQHYTA
jgi:hypothetical protein